MNTETVNIKKLKPNPANPRTIKDDKFHKLVQSVKAFPEMLKLRPIVVNDKMEVLGGNMRLRACIEAGMSEVSIIRASELTEDQQREFIIKDNVGFGEWDMDALANEWDAEELQEWGLDLPGFDSGSEAQEDDYEMPDEIETDIVLGDLFEIGRHRLLCGDSTAAENFNRLKCGAYIIVTDPPYGIDLDTDYSGMGASTTKYAKIEGDQSEFDIKSVAGLAGAKEMYLWGGDYFTKTIPWATGTPIVWAKRHSEEENKVFGSAFEVLWVSYKCKRQIWFIRPINQSSERLGKHPTQKPIECMSRAIGLSKYRGIIYDPFLGSGTTMVASEQLDRTCYGMEIDPKYCQVIIDRMLKLDPTLEIKKNGQPYEVPELNKV